MRRNVISFVFMIGAFANMAAAQTLPGATPMPPAQKAASGKPREIKEMVGYIGIVAGSAKVLLDGVEPWIDAKPGQKLSPGTQIKTGADGSVTIGFTDASKVRIGPNAAFKVEEVSRSKVAVYIGLGKMEAWVSKLKKRLFQARNPVAVASVRGTVFSMNVVSPTEVTMMCFQGSLGVTDNFGRSAEVNKGQSLKADAEQGAEPPKAIPPDITAPAEPPISIPELASAGSATTPLGESDAPAAEGEAPAEEAPPEEAPVETPTTTEPTTTAPNPVQDTATASPTTP